jgi:hypothetical protein
MFKRRERKAQSNGSRRKYEGEDGNDSDDQPDQSNAELHKMLATSKQRRTLIHQSQHKRGVDARDLLQGNIISANSNNNLDESSGAATAIMTNSSTRADALSTKTQLPTGGTIVAEEQMIWERKHAAAMEEYVQQKLDQTLSSTSSANIAVVVNDDVHTEDPASRIHVNTTKEQLYHELAAQAAKLSGKGLSTKSRSIEW